jgi:hypothetical protein
VKAIGCLCALLLSWQALAGDAVAPREVIRLFNGTSFSGLYTFLRDAKREDPGGVFSVTNGMIRMTGLGLGYLATTQEFKDFELAV